MIKFLFGVGSVASFSYFSKKFSRGGGSVFPVPGGVSKPQPGGDAPKKFGRFLPLGGGGRFFARLGGPILQRLSFLFGRFANYAVTGAHSRFSC